MPSNDFFEKTIEIVKLIPFGKVTSYGAIARTIGISSSARTVGWVLNSVKERENIPCHRVVNRNGDLSGKHHFATPTLMKDLLLAEGIEFIEERVDMEKYFWDPANLKFNNKLQ